MRTTFRILSKVKKTWSVIVFYEDTRIIFTKPKIMGYADNKRLICFKVDNNSCSRCIYHEITAMGYIIKLIYCNTSIDDVDSHTPYFDVFLWRYFSITEELRNIVTQYILIFSGYSYGILIGKITKFFLVNWVQSCDISKCVIITFNFNIGRRCIPTCSLNYGVHVMTCLHKFRRSY